MLINDEDYYNSMINKNNPFGDGNASKRIVETCKGYFSKKLIICPRLYRYIYI